MDENSNGCTLYLAETVDDRGALTMGVFTTERVPMGSLVGYPDVTIPLVDIPLHNSPVHDEDAKEFWWVWNDLVWDPLDVGGGHEGADVKSAAMGMGSLTRGNPQNPNAMLIQSQYDDADLHRSTDPGAGAISYHSTTAAVATRDIEPGEEVFFNHGFHWYLNPHDQEQALLRNNNLSTDNPRVQEFWKRYEQLEQKHGEALNKELRSKLWGILRDSPMDSAVQQVFPASWTDAHTVSQHVTNKGKRTPEWLQQHGMCIDNLVQGSSTIPEAGRGAFATRPIAKDTVISPAPLVHILDKKALDMYEPHAVLDEHGEEVHGFVMSDEVSTRQLLLNYCFGHKESTKLLCPLGSGTAFINHSPTPNAAIRWSTHESSSLHKQEWLNMTVDELGDKLNIGLMIEYVALRDIKAGEEIFINYGPEWEEAWNQHVQNWSPPQDHDDEEYVSAQEMNDLGLEILYTAEEQEQHDGHSYPSSVTTSCYYEYFPDEVGTPDSTDEFADASQYRVVNKEWNGVDADSPDYLFLRPCRILERHSVLSHNNAHDEFDYKVQMLNADHMRPDQKIPQHEVVVVHHVPRQAIAFTDYGYSTDMHLTNAFRHEMMMDDGLFPHTWRNLR